MKKILLAVFFIIGLTSCSFGSFQSREDFQKELKKDEKISEDFDMPEITYVKADGETIDVASSEDSNTDKENDYNFKEMYGEGKKGKRQNPADIRGNILDTDIDGMQIGISLLPAVTNNQGYSTILSYKRNDQLVEREFGPVAGIAGLSTAVTYDIVDSESGPMLLVSQISVTENQTYSAYYLFSRTMGLIDYLVFSNSTDNIMVTVERLGDIVEYTDAAYTGILSQAIDRRMQTEERYFPSMFGVYGIKYRPVTSLVGEKEMDIGYLPDITGANRILIAKTTSNPINPGMEVDVE